MNTGIFVLAHWDTLSPFCAISRGDFLARKMVCILRMVMSMVMVLIFLVDTRASSIALNRVTAKRLDLDYLNSRPVVVKTASGIAIGYLIMLDLVQVSDIKLYNVEGIVLYGVEPT